MKKFFVGFLATAAVLVVLPMFAAFEAHVINVTAKIENALSVNTEVLDFGTVFPQEHLNKPVRVALSDSFMAEDRVDDVEYFIRQKPKCAWTWNGGTEFDSNQTATGHVIVDPNVEGGYRIDCGEASPVDGLPPDAIWGVLPSLCEYISKEDDNTPNNDGSLASFHAPWTINGNLVNWNDTPGYLAKSANDIEDNWTIDLAVPCFGGYCAQDWADFVAGINASATPAEYTQPKDNEHKIFGCDLWIEVGGISLPDGGVGCVDRADVMLVLDRSGSIGVDLPTLKTAALAFVTALNPTGDGVHMGQTSFSTDGSLDTHLTDNVAMINQEINDLVSNGSTNLADGINLAKTELDNPGDGDDRPDGESPDFMVIITDGQPNVPDPITAQAAGIAAADAAKAAGIEIFVVGVGSGINATTAAYLRDNIASGMDHYYAAANFSDLSAALMAIAACGEGDSNPPPPPPPGPTNPITIFSDDFGSGTTLADFPSWTKHEALTTFQSPSVDGDDTASVNGGRFARIADDSEDDADDTDGWVCRPVDATGFEELRLDYEWRGDPDAETADHGLVQYFTGGTCVAPTGGPNNLVSHDLNAGAAAWASNTVNLPTSLDDSNFLLRFYDDSNANTEFFRVDNVILTGLTI